MADTSLQLTENNMNRKPWKLSWIPALLVALVVAACGDVRNGSNEVVGPEGPSSSTSITKDYQALQEGGAIEYAGAAEKEIGPRGGFLYVDLHYLYVPAGAVNKPTIFRMERLAEGKIGAQMSATTVGSTRKNDAGSRGFRKPVYLYFSYARATNIPGDPANLKIGEILQNGSIATVPTVIYEEHKIAGGTLKHFSDYALIWP